MLVICITLCDGLRMLPSAVAIDSYTAAAAHADCLCAPLACAPRSAAALASPFQFVQPVGMVEGAAYKRRFSARHFAGLFAIVAESASFHRAER